MEATLEEFSTLYPNYAFCAYEGNCEVMETNPKDDKDFRRFVVTCGSYWLIPRKFAAESVSFYGKAGSPAPMRFNCDGVFYSEIDGRKCLFVCELKSSFSADQIAHAKEQIVGTVLRLKALTSILQTSPEWEIHGVIVSYEPTIGQITFVNKLTSRDASFSKHLIETGHKKITAEMARKYYKPMAVPDITFHYVAVPERQPEYQMSLTDLIKL